MAEKSLVFTDNAPKTLPEVWSQAIKANGFVFVSGAIPMDPDSGEIIPGDIQAHTHQCIKNLTAVLEAAGSDILKVVKVNVFLSNIDNIHAMNEVYSKYWGEVKPSRTCVAVTNLPLDVDIEIECTATY
ncbi:endoribonuclease L-PSP [Xylaria sp. FL1777]|nr:endoribonuclease L-PSP [Xylaria sp. FL1777]